MDNFEAEVAKEVVKQLPINEMYEDFKELGKKAEYLLPQKCFEWLQQRQIRSMVGRANIEKTRKMLEKKLEFVDSTLIEPPESYIAFPALLALSYSMDSDELREMYANLLAASMTVTKKQYVHPAFVEIIKQMTPDEANIFKILPRKGLYEPIIDIIKVIDGYDGTFTHYSNVSVLGFEAECDFPENIPQNIDNLCRLGLTEIPVGSYLIDNWRYDKIINHNYFKQSVGELQKYQIQKKSFGITDLGNSFKNICFA